MKKLLSSISIVIMLACNDPEIRASHEYSLQQLKSPAGSVSSAPWLFTDTTGVVYLSWIETQDNETRLKYAVLNNGNWSEASTITSGSDWFVNWADYPMLVSDGNGYLLAHFLQKSAAGKYTYDVKLVSSVDGGSTWSHPGILHDDGKKAEHGFVSMLPYKDQFFVSWLDGRNTVTEKNDTAATGHHPHQGAMTLRGCLVNKQGVKTAEWELDNRVCDCCQTTATLSENGPVVIYRDRSENEVRDISIVRYVNDKWTAPKRVANDKWKIDGCPVNGPRADALGNDLVVAWFTAPSNLSQVNIAFSGDGGATFDTPIRISEKNSIGRVDVVMLDNSTAMICWMENGVIKAAVVHRNGRKEPSLIIASSTEARSGGFPQMTKAGNELFFAWTDDKKKMVQVAKLSVPDR